MKQKDAALIALAIEGGAWLYQRLQNHPVRCSCGSCVTINLSIPLTLPFYFGDHDEQGSSN